jgi:hypothetical protein
MSTEVKMDQSLGLGISKGNGTASVGSQRRFGQPRKIVPTRAGNVCRPFSKSLLERVVWRCPNIKDGQSEQHHECPFFLWEDHEAAAKVADSQPFHSKTAYHNINDI